MTANKYENYLDREQILAFLSDDEIASVSSAEAQHRLLDGDEYVDLGHPTRGVQKATGYSAPMARVLPRKAVTAATWKKIVAHVTPRP